MVVPPELSLTWVPLDDMPAWLTVVPNQLSVPLSLACWVSRALVVVPLLKPLAAAYGIDPVQMGVIFIANLELGYLHPPVGINLFLAAYRFKKPMGTVIWATLPFLFILMGTVLLLAGNLLADIALVAVDPRVDFTSMASQ